MSVTNFSIVYEGEPVETGTIDARDLAPALLAFADLLDEAAPLADPNLPQVSLRVRPNFKKGSFEVYLNIAGFYDQFVGMFSSNDAQAWSAFLGIVGISGFGIFQLILRSKGRKPTSITFERTETVRVTFEGEEPLEVDSRLWKLFQNFRARKAIEKIVSPVLDRGYASFRIKRNGEDALFVDQDSAEYLRAPSEHEGESSSDAQTRLVIVSPSFNPGNKWRVSDGGRTLHVSIQDESFQRAVQNGAEAFRKGDTLHVTLRTTQWLEEGKLQADYAIVKVHQHDQAPWQPRML